MAKPRPRKKVVRKKRITTQRKKQIYGIIVGGLMILLMVVGMAGYGFNAPGAGPDLTYGDYEFVLEQRPNGGSVLTATMGTETVEFQNLPDQVGYLDMSPTAIGLLRNAQQIALVSDPTAAELQRANIDYARLQMTLAFQKPVIQGMNAEGDHGQVVLGCDRSSQAFPVVMFNLSNETTRITTEGTCIYLTGLDREMMRLKDRVIFEYYGILRDGEVVDE